MLVVAVIYFFENLKDCLITTLTTSDYKRSPQLNYFGTKTKVKIIGSCLKQEKITYDHGKIVNIYFIYKISRNININVKSILIQTWIFFTS